MSNIGVSVVIDPSGAVQGGRTAVTSLDKIEKAADKTTKTTGKLNGMMGAAGYQIADFASQVQYGGNVLGAFGVQGGQLLSVINPMAGAFLTVAGIVGGQYLMSTEEATEATKSLTDQTLDLKDAFTELTQNQAVYLSAKLDETLASQGDEAAVTRAKIETLNMQLSRFPGSAKAEEWNASLIEQQANYDTLTSSIDDNLKTRETYNKVIAGESIATENVNRQLASLNQNVAIAELQYKGLNREASILAATQRLGADATAAEVRQVELLTGRLFDLNEKQSTLNVSVKEYDKDGQYLQRLQDQAAAIGLNARESAMLRGEQGLSEQATAAQIEQSRNLAAAIYDETEAKRLRLQTDREAKQDDKQATQFSMGIVGDATGLEALEQQRAIVLGYQEQELGDAQAHAAALVSLERQTLAERANIASSGLGSLLSIQKAFGDDSSGIYKALLVTQKAATLYSVLLSSQDALGKAWSSAPFPYNLGAVATTAVETGALQAGVQAITPSFATGGLAYGPGTGTSDSFRANLSNGEFVMPQRETMRNLGTLQSMRAGNDVTSGSGDRKIVIQNYTTGRIDSVEQYTTADEVRILIREEAPNVMNAEIANEYSGTNRALSQQYTMQRKF